MKNVRFAVALLLLTAVLLVLYNASRLPQRSALGSKARKRVKKRRAHLYEICPHQAIRLDKRGSDGPIENKEGGTKDGLTVVVKGDIPVVVSVPHGASAKDSVYGWQQKNLALRGSTEAFDAESFQSRLSRVNSDTFTQELGKAVVKHYQKLYGKRPYLVAARFHRRFVDVNRRINITAPASIQVSTCCEAMFPKCTAIADGEGEKVRKSKEVYLTYHRTIIQMLKEIRRYHPKQPILFLDIHAQRAQADEALKLDAEFFESTVIAGTQDGRCVRDRAKLYRRGGLLYEFAQAMTGFGQVYPPSNNEKDHPRYNGGHIVAEYGFNNTLGAAVDAVQLEFGYKLRMKSKLRDKVSVALAQAISKTDYVIRAVDDTTSV